MNGDPPSKGTVRLRGILLIVVLSLSLFACGGNDDDSGQGILLFPLWVAIDDPFFLCTDPRGVLQPCDVTDSTFVNLFGKAQCDNCPPSESGGFCPPARPVPLPIIDVTWRNRSTNVAGDASEFIDSICTPIPFGQLFFRTYSLFWSASVPLILGENLIVATASGPGGTPGSDAITITRVPEKVQGVTAAPGTGQVTVIWNPVAGATAFNLYWSTSRDITTNTGTKIANIVSPFVHTGLSAGVTYYYLVTVEINGVESLPSNLVSATAG